MDKFSLTINSNKQEAQKLTVENMIKTKETEIINLKEEIVQLKICKDTN